MRKKKTIFYCSDIHGYYREMIESLNSAGYDEIIGIMQNKINRQLARMKNE